MCNNSTRYKFLLLIGALLVGVTSSFTFDLKVKNRNLSLQEILVMANVFGEDGDPPIPPFPPNLVNLRLSPSDLTRFNNSEMTIFPNIKSAKLVSNKHFSFGDLLE